MATKQALTFLVVEDDPVVNQHIADQLRGLGHQVAGQAFDGLEALELAKQLAVDVVLMDLHMWDPETKQENHQAGIEAARAIQAECPTPVVVLTAYEAPDLIREATDAGIDAYLLKPPNPQEIERAAYIALARFADICNLRHLNSDLRQQIARRRQAEEQSHLNENRLQSLFSISQYDAEDVQDLLDYALSEAIRLTGSKIGYIYHYDNEQ